MKELKGVDENTVIHCPTQEEWDKVCEILEQKWKWTSQRSVWSVYGVESCIEVDNCFYSPASYYKEEGFKIIPASEFIRLNSPEIPNSSTQIPELTECYCDGSCKETGSCKNGPSVKSFIEGFTIKPKVPSSSPEIPDNSYCDCSSKLYCNCSKSIDKEITKKVEETFEGAKEQLEVIGYKFKDQKYRKAAVVICFEDGEDRFLDRDQAQVIAFMPNSGCSDAIEKAKVWHWFEPVYRELTLYEKWEWHLPDEFKIEFKSDIEKLTEKLTAIKLTAIKERLNKLADACEIVKRGYEDDGMEGMTDRDHFFYEQCVKALDF